MNGNSNNGDKVTFQMMFWLFIIGSLIGFFLEGIWHIMRKGSWESHPATVWGPFCIIYGFGAVLLYLVSIPLKNKLPIVRFLVYAFVGGAVEYVGSLFQELAFGTVSWDYSGHFLNIGGRVSLKMTALWGLLGLLFFKYLFPAFTQLLCRIDGTVWNVACIILAIFMAVDLAVTSCALIRWRARQNDDMPDNATECFLDEHFSDAFMEKRFPNMHFKANT